jgi:hypothetical protein
MPDAGYQIPDTGCRMSDESGDEGIFHLAVHLVSYISAVIWNLESCILNLAGHPASGIRHLHHRTI